MRTSSRSTVPVQTSRTSTSDSALCPLLFGVIPHYIFYKSAINFESIISPIFSETQILEEDDKCVTPCNCLC